MSGSDGWTTHGQPVGRSVGEGSQREHDADGAEDEGDAGQPGGGVGGRGGPGCWSSVAGFPVRRRESRPRRSRSGPGPGLGSFPDAGVAWSHFTTVASE